MDKPDRLIIERTLDNEASPEEARLVMRWFQTPEGQAWLSHRMDQDEAAILSGSEEEWVDGPIPSMAIYQKIMERLRYRKLRRRLLYAAAVLIPLFLFAGLFWQMDRRFDLLVDAGMQEIVVPKGERMQVVFQDGSRVHLNAGSRIRYPKQFGWSERRVELSGEGWFEVSKNAKRPFIVELGLMDIKVLGTTFDVKAYEEDQMIMIALETGSIDVNASNYESFRMEPGDKALYDKSSRRFEIHRSSDVTKYSTWREDRLVFRSEPLREVLNTISRNYNIEFEVKDTSILDYSYTITIDTTDWRIALKELEKITPIQFKEKVDKIEVYKRD